MVEYSTRFVDEWTRILTGSEGVSADFSPGRELWQEILAGFRSS